MTILDDRPGINALACVFKRAVGRFPCDEVDGVGGGEVSPTLFECECEWEEGGG
jgi:hypothetical protein